MDLVQQATRFRISSWLKVSVAFAPHPECLNKSVTSRSFLGHSNEMKIQESEILPVESVFDDLKSHYVNSCGKHSWYPSPACFSEFDFVVDNLIGRIVTKVKRRSNLINCNSSTFCNHLLRLLNVVVSGRVDGCPAPSFCVTLVRPFLTISTYKRHFTK
ncbi:hypothetical protein TNCV_2399801 [Trichonephila clavipes]|uniref:Uncharacterized protein n=1 Tax=Trichonephila clavipes TaxID=2585209 RepID=A0A8X6SVV4_TRICX|nr:hypothetical protein TNCV_2399801 [Trichonephila clavipes]